MHGFDVDGPEVDFWRMSIVDFIVLLERPKFIVLTQMSKFNYDWFYVLDSLGESVIVGFGGGGRRDHVGDPLQDF